MRRESRIAGLVGLVGLAGIVCLLLQTLDPEVLFAGLGIKLGVMTYVVLWFRNGRDQAHSTDAISSAFIAIVMRSSHCYGPSISASSPTPAGIAPFPS